MELENVELAPLVETVVSAHSLPARAKMMHTDVDLKATACLAEPMLLMSVLDNLYSNAVHYGAESGNICLRSSSHGARVYIDVINTGTPIPQEERAMIFEPFFSGKPPAKRGGEGQRSGIKHCQGLYSPYARGNCIWSTRAGKTFVSALNYRRRKTRNNANSLSYRLFYLSVRPRAVLEIFTYDMYAPVSPRCPCPDCLQQLRPLG